VSENENRDEQKLDAEPESRHVEELYELVLGGPPRGLTSEEAFAQLRDALAEIRGFVRRLAQGVLGGEFSVPGPVAGSLKSLSSSLRHMTWQAKEISEGDLSQRIDFLGDFSIAFNEMAERLDATLTELRTRERELSEANVSLQIAHGQLLEQATHDPLTGLLNRRSLSERWVAEAARADRTGEPVAVMLVDLDEFKSINDSCGHEGGDIALVAFAQTLISQLRASDIACRMGGDEFIAILPGTTREGGLEVANRVRDAFGSAELGPMLVNCEHTASIGMAEYPAHGENLEAVLRAADEALYEVKAAGRNRVVCAI
jgi:two-component system, cell cycle response regulator